MAWTDIKTITVDGETVVLQRGSGDDDGHRITVDGVPGDVFPVAEVAKNGDYYGVQAEFNLKQEFLPELFKASESGAAFPAGPVTLTMGSPAFANNSSFSLCDGAGELHSWAIANNAGVGGDDDFIDGGGGPSPTVFATRVETRINAIGIAGLTVDRVDNVITLTSANGIVAFSSDAAIVVS